MPRGGVEASVDPEDLFYISFEGTPDLVCASALYLALKPFVFQVPHLPKGPSPLIP